MIKKSINVLITDDHALVRQGMVFLLQEIKGVDRILEANDGKEAIDILLSEPIDVVILDVRLPGVSGWDIARDIRKRKLLTRIVLMTGGDVSEGKIANLIVDLSIDAFLFKSADMNHFKKAVRMVLDGKTYFPQNLKQKMVNNSDSTSQLSTREKQVIKVIAEGHTSESAARVLGISPLTIRKHRENIRRKLDYSNVADLLAYAHRNGLL
jgi:DNA-binding NarL/FixJ family response regulator